MSVLYLHLSKVRSYIGSGTKKGMTLLCGGRMSRNWIAT